MENAPTTFLLDSNNICMSRESNPGKEAHLADAVSITPWSLGPWSQAVK